MTRKVYSVKSNARRDARKRGLDPNLVVAVPGGFVIGEPKAAGESKTKILGEMLAAGGQTRERLEGALGWQAHTVRGAISALAKSAGLVVERRRVDGVTSYRAVKPS